MNTSCVAAAQYPPLYWYAVSFTNLSLKAPYAAALKKYTAGNTSDSIWPAVKTFVGIPPFAYQNSGNGVFASEFGGIDNMVCECAP